MRVPVAPELDGEMDSPAQSPPILTPSSSSSASPPSSSSEPDSTCVTSQHPDNSPQGSVESSVVSSSSEATITTLPDSVPEDISPPSKPSQASNTNEVGIEAGNETGNEATSPVQAPTKPPSKRKPKRPKHKTVKSGTASSEEIELHDDASITDAETVVDSAPFPLIVDGGTTPIETMSANEGTQGTPYHGASSPRPDSGGGNTRYYAGQEPVWYAPTGEACYAYSYGLPYPAQYVQQYPAQAYGYQAVPQGPQHITQQVPPPVSQNVPQQVPQVLQQEVSAVYQSGRSSYRSNSSRHEPPKYMRPLPDIPPVVSPTPPTVDESTFKSKLGTDTGTEGSAHLPSKTATVHETAESEALPKLTVPKTASPKARASVPQVVLPETREGSVNESKETMADRVNFRFATCDYLEQLAVSRYLLECSYIGKLADSKIVLNSASGEMFYPITWATHRVLIAQSPVLEAILNRQEVLEQKLTIELVAGKKYSLPRAFECAFQAYYGLPMVDHQDIKALTRRALGWEGAPEGQGSDEALGAQLDFMICYMTAGAFMNCDELVAAGFRMIEREISLINLETAIHFGTHPEDYIITHDPADERKTTKKGAKGKARKKSNVELPVVPENMNEEVIERQAPAIASLAIESAAGCIGPDFVFDRTAWVKVMQDRIPHYLRTGMLASNPSLAGVHFGVHPQPSRESSILSAVLLAIPFRYLQEVFQYLRSDGLLTLKLVKEVLQEREIRRLDALQEYHRRHPKKKDLPATHATLGYREFAVHFQIRDMLDEVLHDVTVHREWTGYEDVGQGKGLIREYDAL